MHHAARSLFCLASLLCCVAAGCESLPAPPPPIPRTDEVGGNLQRLSELQPAEVAVPVVRDQTGQDRLPLDAARRAFQEALADRLYTPLAADFVDANWVDSAFRGTPPPDAVLLVAVDRFDPSRLYSSGRVALRAEIALFEGADTSGTLLWTRSFEHVVQLQGAGGGPPAPSPDWIPEALRRFARAALAELPERRPELAPRKGLLEAGGPPSEKGLLPSDGGD